MKNQLILLFLLFIISSCGTTNEVNNGNHIQKRKYTKGFFLNRSSAQSNSNKSDEKGTLSAERKLIRKDLNKDTIGSENIAFEQEDTIDRIILVNTTTTIIGEDAHYDYPENADSETSTRTQEKESKESTTNSSPDDSGRNEFPEIWLILAYIILIITFIALGTLISAESASVLFTLAPILLAQLFWFIYVNSFKRKAPGGLAKAFTIVFLLFVLLSLFFYSLSLIGWTVIPLLLGGTAAIAIGISGFIFYFRRVDATKDSSKDKMAKNKKILLFALILFLIMIALLIITINYIHRPNFLTVLVILFVLNLAFLLVLSIYHLTLKRKLKRERK